MKVYRMHYCRRAHRTFTALAGAWRRMGVRVPPEPSEPSQPSQPSPDAPPPPDGSDASDGLDGSDGGTCTVCHEPMLDVGDGATTHPVCGVTP